VAIYTLIISFFAKLLKTGIFSERIEHWIEAEQRIGRMLGGHTA